MQRIIFIISGLFVFSAAFSQDKLAIFPDDYTGIYKGSLQIHTSNAETQEIPMEFHLQSTNSMNRFDYILVYDGQPRNYTMVVIDRDKGIYELDENNGIVLPMNMKEHILSSIFQVDKSLLITRMEFSGNQIDFEILSTRMDGKKETGIETAYDVFGFPVSGMQSAVLYRKEHSAVPSSGFKWPEGKQMALSLTFDDARFSQVDKGIPLLNKHAVKGTFYVSPEAMLARIDDWKEALASGHDIGNHTLVHPCSGNFPWSRHKALEDYTLEKMAQELDSASRLINHVLGIWPTAFAYTCGQSYVGRGVDSRSYVPLVAARFETGRNWMNEGPNDPAYCDLARLNGTELDGLSFAEALKLIKAAREQGAWLVFAGHEMDEEGRQTVLLPTLDSICQYAADPANGIWIDHVSTIGDYVREKRGLPELKLGQKALDSYRDLATRDRVASSRMDSRIQSLEVI